MGVLVDVYVGDIADAQKIAEIIDTRLESEFVWAETPGLSTPLLAGLLCYLVQKSFDSKLAEEFPVLVESPTAVTKISDELVALLASLEDSSVRRVAEAWMTHMNKLCDEGLVGPWDTIKETDIKYVEPLLNQLRQLSRKAIEEKKSLLLRECP